MYLWCNIFFYIISIYLNKLLVDFFCFFQKKSSKRWFVSLFFTLSLNHIGQYFKFKRNICWSLKREKEKEKKRFDGIISRKWLVCEYRNFDNKINRFIKLINLSTIRGFSHWVSMWESRWCISILDKAVSMGRPRPVLSH